MKFADIQNDTPRLVVMFRRPAPNQEQFQWGIVGKLPVLTLIGYIHRVQVELPLIEPQDTRYHCPESALVIVWDVDNLVFHWFVHPDIPMDSLVGMLETIKAAMVDSKLAQQVRNQQVGLLGPDGQPIKR